MEIDYTQRWCNERFSSLFIENKTRNIGFAEQNALNFYFGTIVPKNKYDLNP